MNRLFISQNIPHILEEEVQPFVFQVHGDYVTSTSYGVRIGSSYYYPDNTYTSATWTTGNFTLYRPVMLGGLTGARQVFLYGNNTGVSDPVRLLGTASFTISGSSTNFTGMTASALSSSVSGGILIASPFQSADNEVYNPVIWASQMNSNFTSTNTAVVFHAIDASGSIATTTGVPTGGATTSISIPVNISSMVIRTTGALFVDGDPYCIRFIANDTDYYIPLTEDYNGYFAATLNFKHLIKLQDLGEIYINGGSNSYSGTNLLA